MIKFPGVSIFSDGVKLTQPKPISHNLNRVAGADAAHVKAANIKARLTTAHVGIATSGKRKI